jgi:hypothetical protein
VGHLDRKVHGVDVIEHVLRGVQLLSDDKKPSVSDSEIVDLHICSWLAGSPISAVRIDVLETDD